jgi:hypothetical protein
LDRVLYTEDASEQCTVGAARPRMSA